MQVSIYSREAVTKLLHSNFPKNVAVISFCDPPSANANMAKAEVPAVQQQYWNISIRMEYQYLRITGIIQTG